MKQGSFIQGDQPMVCSAGNPSSTQRDPAGRWVGTSPSPAAPELAPGQYALGTRPHYFSDVLPIFARSLYTTRR